MGKFFKRFIFVILQCIISVNLLAKQDSTKALYIGIETGYLSYASIDEIFTPYRYTGNTATFGFNKLSISSNKINQITFNYAQMVRVPATLQIKKSFVILSSDAGSSNLWKTEPSFSESKTIILNLSSNHYIKTSLHLISSDKIYFGIKNSFDGVLRPNFTNPELISLTINPGFYYCVTIRKICLMSVRSNLNLLGISIRRPYAGADAQLTNNYNFEYFKNYVIEHLQFDFINKYFQLNSQINIERALNKRIIASIGYQVNYLDLQNPRRLVSLTNNFIFGFTVKLK
jgi:hypothetical protein